MIRTIGPLMSNPIAKTGQGPANTPENTFANTLKGFIKDVDTQLMNADTMMGEFVVGKRTDLHNVMIETEKADLSLKLLLRIRSKLIEAYQEIMRMQV